jgi:hypothetical protein
MSNDRFHVRGVFPVWYGAVLAVDRGVVLKLMRAATNTY